MVGDNNTKIQELYTMEEGANDNDMEGSDMGDAEDDD